MLSILGIGSGEGYKEIKDIKAGDEVYSENSETGEKGLKKVVNVFVKEVHQIVHIVADGEDINTTPTHPFWVEGKGWTEAGDIKAGDKLKMYSGEILEVKSAYVEYLENPVKVYNFEVEDWHTYFVSEHSVFVHNGCGIKASKVEEWVDPRSGKTKQTMTLENEDDLFEAFEIERDGKKYTEDPGGNYWSNSDGDRRIEFSEGHEPSPNNPLGEGPHVKVLEPKDIISPKGGWWTPGKYKVKGYEHWKRDWRYNNGD